MLNTLLLGMLVLLLLAISLDVAIDGWEALTLGELSLELIVASTLLVGLWLQRRGHLRSVVWLVSTVLLGVAAYLLRNGVGENGSALLIFIAPVTLVGLLLGRSALFFITGLSFAIVGIVYSLELTGSSLIVVRARISDAGAIVIFAVVIGLLVLFLERFALTLRDSLALSEAREAELRREIEEREQVEARLHLTTDAAQVGLWTWHLETNEVDWSDKMKELFEVAPGEEVDVETFLSRVHPEDRERLRIGMDQGEGFLDEPYRLLLPSGKIRWLVGRGRVTVQQDGARQMLGAAYDVTALKEAEAERAMLLAKEQDSRRAVERAGERLEFLAEASHILAESLDFRETLTHVANLAVPRLGDWCAVDVLDDQGELERVVVVHSDPEKIEFAHDLQRQYPPKRDAPAGSYRVLRTGEPQFLPTVSDELLQGIAQDERHLSMLRDVGFESAIIAPLRSRERPLGVLVLVYAESGRHYDEDDLELIMQLAERAAVAVDNSRLYSHSQELNSELEERVESRTAELQEANKELESFSYSASHDLRAPLRGIGGFSQALLDDYADDLDETARGYLQRIHAGAVRMGELIDDLLDLSRISRAELTVEPIDLSALARVVAEELRSQTPERRVDVTVADGLEAAGDPRLFRIALENLLGNAWKFSKDRDPARIEVGWDTEQEAFFVRDNGAGFAMAYSEKLFLPFQRLHRPEEYLGTGIGLATTKRIVERLGGEIWAYGEEEKGATFYFRLPAPKPAGLGPSAAY